MDLYKDKVAIVTGGASGIGRALCEELARGGAVVVVADINKEGADRVASSIAGGRARASHVDVSKEDDVRMLIEGATDEHGRIDYVFNNAGIDIAGDMRYIGLDHWRRIIDINLLGVIHGTLAAYSLMVKQGFGHIVNTASLCGLVPTPLQTAYATTKHGIVGLSTSLRAEGAGLGVKVSVVCPGVVRTGLFDAATVVNTTVDELMSIWPFEWMDVGKAARAILRGVERNQGIIAFPFTSRMSWWFYRFFPQVCEYFFRQSVEKFRKVSRPQ